MLPFISKLERRERFLENTSLILLAVLLVITPIVYFIVPEQVLILGDKAAGALENYNSKSALWLFPLIGFVIYMALSIIKFYIVKYREEPAPGEDPEHTVTVWMLRLVKTIAMAGLIISVLEVLVSASKEGSAAAQAAFVVELVLVASVFYIAFREVMVRYGPKKQ